MNVLFVTAHPAQIHHFNAVKKELEKRGHNVFWLATNKDISLYLLEHFGIKYDLLRRPSKNFWSKVKTFFVNYHRTSLAIKKYGIDFVITRIYPPSVLAAFMHRKKQIGLTDTEITGIYNTIFSRFVGSVMTGKSFRINLVRKQIRYAGNIELFYLHPNRFVSQAPYPLLKISPEDRYAVLRFVSWNAYHDAGLMEGFSDQQKIRLVQELSKFVKVFISSEKTLPAELEPYRISIPLERMHDVLHYADLFIGESATMASESVVLGSPAIYVDEVGRGYTDEECEKGLLYMFHPEQQEEIIAKAKDIVSPMFDHADYEKRHANFISEVMDPTAWLVWYIENYPSSKRTMCENPDYQYNFR